MCLLIPVKDEERKTQYSKESMNGRKFAAALLPNPVDAVDQHPVYVKWDLQHMMASVTATASNSRPAMKSKSAESPMGRIS